MNKLSIPGLLALVIMMLTVQTIPAAPQQAAAQSEERLQVIGSHPILVDVIQNVAGDAADVYTLIPRGTDPHTFELSTQDIVTLLEADVVFINGAYFEESLTGILESEPDINEVVTSMCVPIRASGPHQHDDHEDEDHHEDDHADGEHEEDEHMDDDHEGEDHHDDAISTLCDAHMTELESLTGVTDDYFADAMGPLHMLQCEPHGDHEGDEHAHEGCDSHVWMDYHNGLLWTMQVRDTLSELDPANADTYAANAEAYMQRLVAAVQPAWESLAAIPAENRVFLSNHLAFGYIVGPAEFTTVEAVVITGSTEGGPSLAEFADLVQLVESTGVPAIFAESTTSPDVIEQIASEADVEVVTLYAGSLTEGGDAATYVDYLRYNYQAIADALR